MTDPNLYANATARFDTVVGEHEYFILLRKIRNEFDHTSPHNSYSYEFDQGDFMRFIEQRYGIRPMFDTTYQTITGEFEIVDHDKYLLAKLKFA
jgi:hypothetical protein